MSRADDVREFLRENYPEAKLFESPDYAEALVGVTTNGQAVYDREKCIEHLMNDGATHEEAEDFFCFNTEGSLVGNDPTLPVVVSFSQL